MGFSTRHGLHIERLDEGFLVLPPRSTDVLQLRGDQADAFALALDGVDVVPGHLATAMAGLVELGVVQATGWDRRKVLQLGGGRGGLRQEGGDGGSGGGAGTDYYLEDPPIAGGRGTNGQGNDGGAYPGRGYAGGGGGGGAGAPGGDTQGSGFEWQIGGHGGTGVFSTIAATAGVGMPENYDFERGEWRGEGWVGGGGGGSGGDTGGDPGEGGGGAGTWPVWDGNPGVANTGGGGGSQADGGSGVVVIAYSTAQASAAGLTVSGGRVEIHGPKTYHVFTTVGDTPFVIA